MSDQQPFRSALIPLVVGVTGHRDLVASEIPEIRERVRAVLKEMQQRFPDYPLSVLSALAEGADRLVAEVALELEIKVTLILPMPIESYRVDFEREGSFGRFEDLMRRVDEIYELPILEGSSHQELLTSDEHRSRQYAQLGVFVCAHCHFLLALWDGKPSNKLGSTGQVVQFHHYDYMEGYSPPDLVDQQALADDDSDLVYQIVVSRNRENGQPRNDLKPLDAFWLTGADENVRSDELPSSYRDIFERTNDFNQDIKKFARRIDSESTPLVDDDAEIDLPPAILRVSGAFCTADWLAIHFQQLFHRSVIYTHVSVFAMALMILFYEDVAASQVLIAVFALFLILAFLVHWAASRGRWNGKYLEYRTLAEGLRVQFYWAAAGVTRSNVTKYAHDNFLQKQDPELGWIRNVMREVGTGCDVVPFKDSEGLTFVLDAWIGDEVHEGQLQYYGKTANRHVERGARYDLVGIVLTFVVGILLISAVLSTEDDIRTLLFVGLGIVLLIVSVGNAYSYRIAEKEVVRQYQFMHRIFHNARNRLRTATTDRVRRRILRALGEAALDEHAEWILLHRDRQLSDSQVWRI